MVFATWLMSPHALLGVENLANTNVFARSNAKTTQIPGFLPASCKKRCKNPGFRPPHRTKRSYFHGFLRFFGCRVLNTMRILAPTCFLLPFMGRRPAVRRKPLNPGAGPGRWPVLMPEAFGGNRRLYTGSAPAADRRRVDPCPTFARRLPCNLHCILRVGFKNIVFYSVSWPLGGHGFYLGGVEKPWFLRGFGLQGGEKNGKKSS